MSFGGSASADTKSGSSKTSGTKKSTDRLLISDEGTDKIVQDLLSGKGGLASIFAGEQSSGIFNSSVAAQEAGDFAANVVGEIAKLTAERETTEDLDSVTKTTENAASVETAASFKLL